MLLSQAMRLQENKFSTTSSLKIVNQHLKYRVPRITPTKLSFLQQFSHLINICFKRGPSSPFTTRLHTKGSIIALSYKIILQGVRHRPLVHSPSYIKQIKSYSLQALFITMLTASTIIISLVHEARFEIQEN